MNLTGKNAIVTGASKGIGLATIKTLVEAGMNVAGWSRTAPDFTHERFHHIAADIATYEAVQQAFTQTTKALGSNYIHVLVNNAGLGYQGAVEDMPLDEWHRMFDVNVHGLYYCSRMVIPEMKANDEGHIINISSIAGTNGVETMAGYAATKHAVNGLSHSMYKELRNHGIKITNIMPGSVQTEFFNNVPSVTAHNNMMGPDDIAGTILYVLQTSGNYHVVDVEMRPLKPKG